MRVIAADAVEGEQPHQVVQEAELDLHQRRDSWSARAGARAAVPSARRCGSSPARPRRPASAWSAREGSPTRPRRPAARRSVSAAERVPPPAAGVGPSRHGGSPPGARPTERRARGSRLPARARPRAGFAPRRSGRRGGASTSAVRRSSRGTGASSVDVPELTRSSRRSSWLRCRRRVPAPGPRPGRPRMCLSSPGWSRRRPSRRARA